jgi:uncharacterized iron-regulated membrane protein
VVGALATTDPRPRDLVSTRIAGAQPISATAAVAAASAHVQGATPSFLTLPDGPTEPYQVWLRRPDDVRRVYGDTIVWVDQWSGIALHVRDRRSMPGGEALLHWQFPLHSGEVFGLPGRLIVCGSGLVPFGLFVTGTLIWWRKRSGRRRVQARAKMRR